MLNKKLNIFFIVILLFLNLNTSIHAQNIRVKIYSDINEIKNVSIYVNTGTYAIIATKDTIDKIEPGIPIFLCLKKNIIELKIKNNIIGCFNEISLMGLSLINSFIIKPNDNQKLKRIYEDNLVVTISKNSLFLINYIDIENYIAGVVEAEAGGCSENEEFFDPRKSS